MELTRTDPDESVRLALAPILFDSAIPLPDIRQATIQLFLLNPQIMQHYNNPRLTYTSSFRDTRYFKIEAEVYPPPRGKVYTEQVSVTIQNDTTTIFDQTFRGRRAGKSEDFDETFPRHDDYYFKRYPAQVEIMNIAFSLLKPLDRDLLSQIAASDDKYLRKAAHILLDQMTER